MYISNDFEELPEELKLKILQAIEFNGGRFSSGRLKAQATYYSLCFIPEWKDAATEFLYKRPELDDCNFEGFVKTICTKRASDPEKGTMGDLVKELRLAYIELENTETRLRKLIMAVRKNLRTYKAPLAELDSGCMSALGGCKNITSIDFGHVTQSVAMEQIFSHVERLENLTRLVLPRCDTRPVGATRPPRSLPPNLSSLEISIGTSCQVLSALEVPPSLTSLVFRSESLPRILNDRPTYEDFSLKIRDQLKYCRCDEVEDDEVATILPLFLFQNIPNLDKVVLNAQLIFPAASRLPPETLVVPPYSLRHIIVWDRRRWAPGSGLVLLKNLHKRIRIGQFPKLEILQVEYNGSIDVTPGTLELIRRMDKILKKNHSAINKKAGAYLRN